MRILFVTNNLPFPPIDGWKIRVFALIRGLAARHRVSVVSFLRTTEDPQAVEALRSYCADVWVVPRDGRYSPLRLLAGMVSSTPFTAINYRDRRMLALMSQALQASRADIVQAESLHMAQYCLGVPAVTILDLHNIESVLMERYARQVGNPMKRWYATMTWRKLLAYERRMYREFSHCLTCSEEDRRAVWELDGSLRVSVIPNGVDIDEYVPDESGAEVPNRLLFVGRMDYHANVDGIVWFCEEILPRIRAHCPDVTVQIVGGHPTAEVRRLARPGVVDVTGFVADVRPYFRSASVVLVPLKVGGGTRLKLLQALAMGKAVVSTTVGAEGIEVTSFRNILLADDPKAFARQVLHLLKHPGLRRELGRAGRQLVERRYSWEGIVRNLEQVYDACRSAPVSEGARVFDGGRASYLRSRAYEL